MTEENEMYLVHKKTGLSVMLGRKNKFGWSRTPDAHKLIKFLNMMIEFGQDGQFDFVVAHSDHLSHDCYKIKKYTGEYVDFFERVEVIKHDAKI